MNFKTFYKIFYHHRFLKASFFLKIYLCLTLFVKYLINYFYLPKKKNLDKFDVVIGMYHDQVLTPIKTLFNFKAINITVGLPFIRISPDHGPNAEMIGKNKSDPSSFFYAMHFIKNLK